MTKDSDRHVIDVSKDSDRHVINVYIQTSQLVRTVVNC